MATTPLSSYLKDIEGMIGTVQNNEAIAHCLHILKTFPKNIAVYRLLGKAYLENQRFSDAADVFQRVLSAVPDDFVSNIGMSIIREDEGNFDASIWHMERSFEAQPYNSTIQDELRRLYGRRDGMEPPKMRLTRGALARLYAKGNLYQQAIGELRATLAEDPQRPDLQVLLARYYYLAGYRVEAVETCSTLLKKLPFCLDANTLLSIILPDTERAEDAPNYLQRAESLDPYLTQSSMNVRRTETVPKNTFIIERLSLDPEIGTAEESQPAWATALGVVLKEPSEGEILPAWLTPSAETVLSREGEAKTEEEPLFGESKPPDSIPWETPTKDIIPSGEEPSLVEIPEWMKDAGWGLATGEAKEEPVIFPHDEEPIELPESGLAPAELPDWLRDAAPPGVLDQVQGLAAEKKAEEDLPWLQEIPSGAGDSVDTLLGMGKGENLPPTSEIPAPPFVEASQLLEPDVAGLPEAKEDEIPAWLKESEPISEVGSDEKISELIKEEKSGTEFISDQATSLSELTLNLENETTDDLNLGAIESEIPEWLEELETRHVTEETAPTVTDEVPEWLKGDISKDESPIVEADQFTVSADEIPKWLTAEETTPEIPVAQKPDLDVISTELDQVEETPAKVISVETSTVEGITPIEEIPDWLKEEETVVIPEDSGETPELKGITEWLDSVKTGDLATGSIGITEWLSKLEPGSETPTEKTTPAPTEIFPWLREIESENKEVITEEMLEATKPEELAEITSITDMTPATPAEEIPEWIKEISPEAPETTTVEAPETNIPKQEDIPGESIPAFEDVLSDDFAVSEQDAALTWLEGLDITRDLPQDTLSKESEETIEIPSTFNQEVPSEAPSALSEEFPEGLKTTLTEGLEVAETKLIEVIPPETEELSAIPVEQIPDWLKETSERQEGTVDEIEEVAVVEVQEATMPEESALTAEIIPTPVIEEIPDWLKEASEVPEVSLKEAAGEGQETALSEESELTVEAVLTPAIEEIPGRLEEAITEEQQTPINEIQEITISDVLGVATAEVQEVALPGESALTSEAVLKPAIEEIPDWLNEATTEEQKTTVVEVKELITPEVVTSTTEEVSTPPIEEIPEWLEEAAVEVQEISVSETQESVEVEVQETTLPEDIATTTEMISKDVIDESPDWLKEAIEISETSDAISTPTIEELPDWLKEPEGEETITKAVEVAPPEIPSQPSEWIKETELPEWLEKVEDVQPIGEGKLEAELPTRLVDVGSTEETTWELPQTSKLDSAEKTLDGTITNINTASIDDWKSMLDSDHIILQQAHQAMQQGDVSASVEQYNLLMKKTVLLDEIIQNLQDALYRYPVDMSIWQALGDAYLRNNQLQEAMNAYNKAEELLR